MALQSTCYHLCNPWGVTQNFCYPGFRKCYRVCNRWSVTQNFCYPGFRKCYRVGGGFADCHCLLPAPPCPCPSLAPLCKIPRCSHTPLPERSLARGGSGCPDIPPHQRRRPTPSSSSGPNGCPWKPSRKQSWAGLVSWPSTARKVSAVRMGGVTTCVTGNRYVLPNPLKTGHSKQWCKGDT